MISRKKRRKQKKRIIAAARRNKQPKKSKEMANYRGDLKALMAKVNEDVLVNRRVFAILIREMFPCFTGEEVQMAWNVQQDGGNILVKDGHIAAVDVFNPDQC